YAGKPVDARERQRPLHESGIGNVRGIRVSRLAYDEWRAEQRRLPWNDVVKDSVAGADHECARTQWPPGETDAWREIIFVGAEQTVIEFGFRIADHRNQAGREK